MKKMRYATPYLDHTTLRAELPSRASLSRAVTASRKLPSTTDSKLLVSYRSLPQSCSLLAPLRPASIAGDVSLLRV